MIDSEKYKRSIEQCADSIYEQCSIREGVILIAGASGLIGTVMVDCIMKLNDKYNTEFKVYALGRNVKKLEEVFGVYMGRKDFLSVICDVNDRVPYMGSVDYVIQAASNTHPLAYSLKPIETIKTNIIGTDRLLDYARKYEAKRFLFLSSVEIYGDNVGTKDSFEEFDLGYLDCNTVRAGYPESKRLGESLCRAYEAQYGLDIVIARLCRVYGPTMKSDDTKALSQFIKRAVKNENIILKSKGEQFYSYIYVMDAVKAIFAILDKGMQGEAYNVSSEKSDITLKELAQKLANISSTKVKYEIPDEEEMRGYSKATKAILNNGKLKGIGWKESYNIEQGLKETVEILKTLQGDMDAES